MTCIKPQAARADSMAAVFPALHPRRHRRLTAWIALVAMLAFALVPTVSRALAFANGSANWAEVCSPQGIKWVSLAEGDEAPAPATGHLDHCALCGLASDGAAPLPASPAPAALPVGSAEIPRLFLQAAHTLHAWCLAQPRAPPAWS